MDPWLGATGLKAEHRIVLTNKKVIARSLSFKVSVTMALPPICQQFIILVCNYKCSKVQR